MRWLATIIGHFSRSTYNKNEVFADEKIIIASYILRSLGMYLINMYNAQSLWKWEIAWINLISMKMTSLSKIESFKIEKQDLIMFSFSRFWRVFNFDSLELKKPPTITQNLFILTKYFQVLGLETPISRLKVCCLMNQCELWIIIYLDKCTYR